MIRFWTLWISVSFLLTGCAPGMLAKTAATNAVMTIQPTLTQPMPDKVPGATQEAITQPVVQTALIGVPTAAEMTPVYPAVPSNPGTEGALLSPPQPAAGMALLWGKVTVGPLTPVERAPEKGKAPTPIPPQVFTSRSIDILQPNGMTLVQNVPFNGDGTYQVELPPGNYIVKLSGGGMGRAAGLPKMVQLQAGQVEEMDINIDTGIR